MIAIPFGLQPDCAKLIVTICNYPGVFHSIKKKSHSCTDRMENAYKLHIRNFNQSRITIMLRVFHNFH